MLPLPPLALWAGIHAVPDHMDQHRCTALGDSFAPHPVAAQERDLPLGRHLGLLVGLRHLDHQQVLAGRGLLHSTQFEVNYLASFRVIIPRRESRPSSQWRLRNRSGRRDGTGALPAANPWCRERRTWVVVAGLAWWNAERLLFSMRASGHRPDAQRAWGMPFGVSAERGRGTATGGLRQPERGKPLRRATEHVDGGFPRRCLSGLVSNTVRQEPPPFD